MKKQVQQEQHTQAINTEVVQNKSNGNAPFVDNSTKTQKATQLQAAADQYSQNKGTAFVDNKAPVQRVVNIGGTEVKSIADYLAEQDSDRALSPTESEMCTWMLTAAHPWDFASLEELLVLANRASSTEKLLISIFTNGILSRREMAKKQVDYTGSEDVGENGGLAVNVLDNRKNIQGNSEMVNDSLTSEDRGSISVALERKNDRIKTLLKKATDMALSETEVDEIKNNPAYKDLVEDETMLNFLLKDKKQQKATDENERMLNEDHNPEMEKRAMTTIMAVIHQPSEKIANLSTPERSYEGEVPSGSIPPTSEEQTEDTFSTLLIPNWFEPFHARIRDHQPPHVATRFVGTKTITAHYKTGDGHLPVTVDAPDYESELTPLLTEFKLLVTHILTA